MGVRTEEIKRIVLYNVKMERPTHSATVIVRLGQLQALHIRVVMLVKKA